MTKNELKWTVVLVERGMATDMRCFRDPLKARRAMNALLGKSNPQEDDVALFEMASKRRPHRIV